MGFVMDDVHCVITDLALGCTGHRNLRTVVSDSVPYWSRYESRDGSRYGFYNN